MRPIKAQGTAALLLTLLLASLLAVLPLPDWLALGRPEWITLVLLFWVMALPYRIGVGWAFGVGLYQDVLVGALLGQHAIALAVVAYIAQAVYKRMRVFPPMQQSVVVFLLVGTGAILSYLIQSAEGRILVSPVWVLLPALVSALIWRPLFGLLRWVQLRFSVR